MFDLIAQELEDYCEDHTSQESELLYRLYRENQPESDEAPHDLR